MHGNKKLEVKDFDFVGMKISFGISFGMETLGETRLVVTQVVCYNF